MPPAFPSAMMRAVSWPASPLMPPGITSTSPVWIPARMSRPMPRTAARISSADCTARRAVEHGQESVAGRADFGTAVTFQDLPDECVMAVEQLIPDGIADRGRPVSGSSYVGDQHRGQYPLTDRRLTPATPAAPDDRRHWFVADDPVVVPGWDIKNVPGPGLELGAVIHPAIHGARQHESHMMELAACRPADGAHMLRPPPAGLQHQPADHHLSDPDRARRCPLEREDFVGTRQVLRSRRSCVHPSLPRSAAQYGTLTPLGPRELQCTHASVSAGHSASPTS